MKFTKIQLRGLTVVDLPLINVSSLNPYILKNAEGLGPPNMTLFLDQNMDLEGFYKGRQTQYREVILTIGLNPIYTENITVADLRSSLYSGLLTPTISDVIEIGIFDDSEEIMVTQGFVKSMDVSIFTETPEIKLVLSCMKPYFEAPSVVHVDVQPGLTLDVLNTGTAATGLCFDVKFTEAMSLFSIVDSRGNQMILNNNFKVNEVLHVNTHPGNRFITLTDSFETNTLIYALSMDSNWVWLYGGLNTFTFNTTAFTFEDFYYTPQYWGI